MESLTRKEIGFIENYLKNSGVEYTDVRLEMTDHVASEIESRMADGDDRGFYLIFKDYMSLNKAILIKSLKSYRKEADKKVSKSVVKNLLHPISLGLGAVIFAVIFFLRKTGELETFHYHMLFYFGIVVIYLLPYFLTGKNNYISLNRLTLQFGIIMYVLLLLSRYVSFPEGQYLWINIGMAWCYASIIKTSLDLVSFYRKNYKLL